MAKDLNDPPANENAPLPGEANPTHDIQAVESLILKPNSRTPRARLASGFNGDNIPDTLKANARWAPWKAVFNEKRQKFDKIPHQTTAPFYRISTAHPDRWYSYEVALKAFQDNPTRFAGIGYVITGSHGVVGIDLDGCVNDNTIEEWALEVIKDLASYTELSPSGKGLRILVAGEIGRDWTNHERGIEVYGGHAPRFLTVTGQRLKMSVLNMTRPDPRVLGELDGMYAKAESAPTAPDKEMPDLVEELLVADISQLGLPYKTSDFLADGTAGGDRSRTLFTAAIDLYKAGLADDMVVSVLAYNEHAMGVALSHRRYDHDRALAYLWDEHCVKAKAKVGDITPVIELFDNVSAPSLAVVLIAPTGETPAPAVPANRFEFQQFADYLDRKPISWIIKRILPQAEIGVVYGESTAGKTFFVLDLVMSVATGTPWKDRLVAQGTVAYICAEGAGGFALRMKAYAEHHDIDGTTVPLHVLAGAPNFLDKADIKDLVS